MVDTLAIIAVSDTTKMVVSDTTSSVTIANYNKLTEQLSSSAPSGTSYIWSKTDLATTTDTVGVKPQTISFALSSDAVKEYGDPTFALQGSASSSLPVTYTSSDTSVARISGDQVIIGKPGTTVLRAVQRGNLSYDMAKDATAELRVTNKTLTITANSLSKAIADTDPTFTVSYSPFAHSETDTVVKGLTIVHSAGSDAGTYPITLSGATAQNYTIKYVAGKLTIQPDTVRIPLRAGWNTVSFNLKELAGGKIDSVLADVSALKIAKDGSANSYVPDVINTIGTVSLTSGYKLYSSEIDTLTVLGTPVDSKSAAISLNAGWNMISYLPQTQSNVETVFALIADKIEMVRNGMGEVYIPSQSINTIGAMVPGQGYQIYMKEAVEFTYPVQN